MRSWPLVLQGSKCHISHTERTKLHCSCGLYPVCHAVRNLRRGDPDDPSASPDGSGETHSGLTDLGALTSNDGILGGHVARLLLSELKTTIPMSPELKTMIGREPSLPARDTATARSAG